MKFEIIIVDNASDYDVRRQLAKSAWRTIPISLIQNKTNIGFGKANNKGAKKATGTYLLFLNTDIEVLDDAINSIYSCIRSHDETVIIGGKLFNADMSDQPSAGPFYSLPVVFAMLFLKGDFIGLTRYSPHTSQPVDWVSGACIMMKRETFVLLDGFDEKIFMYMEEVDLIYRARMNGIRTLFCSEAQFIHLGAATSKSRTMQILNIYEGLTYFYLKHHSRRDQYILNSLLKTKAGISIILGKIMGRRELVETYSKALKIVEVRFKK